MGILEEVIKELGTSELDQQVRELSDIITQEERGGKEYDGPDGPNVFLSLNAIDSKKQKTYVTLEREGPEKYIVAEWTRFVKRKEDEVVLGPLKRIQVTEVKEQKANKIVKEFASKLIFVQGK